MKLGKEVELDVSIQCDKQLWGNWKQNKLETYPNDVRPQSHIVNSRYDNSSYVMKNNGFEVHVSEWWNNGHTLLLLFNNDLNVTQEEIQQHSRLKSVKDAISLMLVPISNRDIA
ncbi:hypothetical protein RFI_38382, partial [Reticulomyxa filosa]